MHRLDTEVLVIGGGATGTGVIRDLAMRGFKSILVEKRDLTYGTTGRYHGLLHSGGRYVVKDAQAARECIEENRILRRIMPQCIEDTGGFFVLTPSDDANYIPSFIEGCRIAGIPVQEVSHQEMLREEPLLDPRIEFCLRVPDASADSFLAADLNAQSARQYGAVILRYHEVIELLMSNQRVIGVKCHDLIKDEMVEIYADFIVNASGAWAAKIADLAGINIPILPGKGTMIATNHRIVNTVINRCKLPSDGDILVPIHTVSIIGTTDVKVSDPEHFAIEPWEVRLMLEEGEKLIPGFKNMRMLRAWAGVRPLYQETTVADTRDVSRAFVLLDHEQRDGVSGFITITSGKWTTYRKMGEATVDLVCSKLGVRRPCTTHLENLPGEESRYFTVGSRLAYIEATKAFGRLVCECELATYEEIAGVISSGEAVTIDDIRRDVRMGMGPCQGGFCTYRVAGIMHRLRRQPVEETNLALRDFLAERWRGLIPILWGQQLRQERFDELVYLSLMNADHLPGKKSSRLTVEPYSSPSSGHLSDQTYPLINQAEPDTKIFDGALQSWDISVESKTHLNDVIVVGGGLAGLSVAWQAAARGKRTRVLTSGWGALYWHAGCVDVLGYHPDDRLVESPVDALRQMISIQPEHPYSHLGIGKIEKAIDAFRQFCDQSGYPMLGSIDSNWLLPSSLGVARPTCLAPSTMVAGDMRSKESALIIGFNQFLDFYPELVADNLLAQGLPATSLIIDLPMLRGRNFVTGRTLAELFDTPEFLEDTILTIKNSLNGNPRNVSRIGFPAVLGLRNALFNHQLLEKELGLKVFEIPTLPPSIPGIRLHQLLIQAIERLGGRVLDGIEVTQSIASNGNGEPSSQLLGMVSDAAGRPKVHRAAQFILATGGILGGGIQSNFDTRIIEVVCNLQVRSSGEPEEQFSADFLSASGQKIYRSGVSVDKQFQPIDHQDRPVYKNLRAVGALLAGGDYIRERSLDGVSLATGYWVGNAI